MPEAIKIKSATSIDKTAEHELSDTSTQLFGNPGQRNTIPCALNPFPKLY